MPSSTATIATTRAVIPGQAGVAGVAAACGAAVSLAAGGQLQRRCGVFGLGLALGRLLVPAHHLAVTVGLHGRQRQSVLLGQRAGGDAEHVELVGRNRRLRIVGLPLHRGDVVGDLVPVVVLQRRGKLLFGDGGRPPRLGLCRHRDDRLVVRQRHDEVGRGSGVGFGGNPKGQHAISALTGIRSRHLDMSERRCGQPDRSDSRRDGRQCNAHRDFHGSILSIIRQEGQSTLPSRSPSVGRNTDVWGRGSARRTTTARSRKEPPATAAAEARSQTGVAKPTAGPAAIAMWSCCDIAGIGAATAGALIMTGIAAIVAIIAAW